VRTAKTYEELQIEYGDRLTEAAVVGSLVLVMGAGAMYLLSSFYYAGWFGAIYGPVIFGVAGTLVMVATIVVAGLVLLCLFLLVFSLWCDTCSLLCFHPCGPKPTSIGPAAP